MTKTTADRLVAVESGLNRSFGGAVVAAVAGVVWSIFVVKMGMETSPGGVLVSLGLLACQLGCYLWYAVAVGSAARVLEEPPWGYVAWILLAPFLAMIPIPIVSTLIGVSPLSIKFLLKGQLESAIRNATFED